MNVRTEIGYSERNRIVVRGRDLARDVIGKMDFVDMLFLLIFSRGPEEGEKRMVNALLVTAADHGLTPITLAARLTMLGAPEALQGAVAAGLLGGGDRFLGTTQTVCEMLVKACSALPDAPDDNQVAEAARAIVADHRAQRRFVPGFGHPIHTDGDPRVPALVAISRDNGYYTVHWRLLHAIEAAIADHSGRKLPLNGAGAMGAMFAELGFAPMLARGLALVGRCAGIVAHLVEESQAPIAADVWKLVLDQDPRNSGGKGAGG